MVDCFRQLGMDVVVGSSWHTGLVLSKWLQAGHGALHRLPHSPAFHRSVCAVNTPVTPPPP